MAYEDDGESIARDETRDLISSDKVEGTIVYNREGERLGTIHCFMVGKRNGRVEYAVLSFGGLFGIGERYHPLPWDVLQFDTERRGYVVDLDREMLEKAPYYQKGNEPTYDQDYGERVYSYYGVPY